MRDEEYADLIIPELEEAPFYTRSRPWTAFEDAVLEKYYMTRKVEDLEKYFSTTDTPRTASAISSRASVLKLTTSRQSCQKK